MNTETTPCPVCHFGRLQPRNVTYTQVFGGQFIVIPNVPALVCDVCGEKVFDRETLNRLSGLLGQGHRDMGDAPQRHSWP